MRNLVRIVSLALIFSLLPSIPAATAAGPAGARERLIVVVDPGSAPQGVAEQVAAATGGRVGFLYEHALSGFTIELPPAAVNGLRNMPGVAFVEPDVQVEMAAQAESTGYDRIDADLNPSGQDYSGIDIAVLDTGVWYDVAANTSHEDLNLAWVTDCTGAILYPLFGGCTAGGVDGNGHGTHVAGIAAACDNTIGTRGVSPCATIWSFKVLGDNGTGSLGAVLAAVDLVAANADQIEVANMSLVFEGGSQALTTAVNNAVSQGVAFVVAAGNNGADAALYSPASIDSAITVSSVTDYDGAPGGLAAATCYPDSDDMLAEYSNTGPKVDIAAPGTCITSTHLNNGYATFSGTSMAAPTVAGALARYFHDNAIDPTTAAHVTSARDALVSGGMPQAGPCGFGGDTDGFAEPLLFMNGSAFNGTGTCGGGAPPTNDPPTAVITAPSCDGLACTFDGSNSTDDNGIATYLWDFDDGTTSSQATTTHTYANPGTYTVSLTVTDADGASDAAVATVEATDPNADVGMTTAVAGFAYDGQWATVPLFVSDLDFNAVEGAEVSGTWSYLDRRNRVRTKSASATTDAIGLAEIRTRFRNVTPIEFCVTDITKPGYVYIESLFPCGGLTAGALLRPE